MASITSSDKDVENPDGRKSTVLSLLRGSNAQGSTQTGVIKIPETGQHTAPSVVTSGDTVNQNSAEIEEKADESSKKVSKALSLQHIEVSSLLLVARPSFRTLSERMAKKIFS